MLQNSARSKTFPATACSRIKGNVPETKSRLLNQYTHTAITANQEDECHLSLW